MKKNARYLLFLIATSLSITACTPKKVTLSCSVPAIEKAEPADLAVNVYVDSTLSMQGFTQDPEGNYVRALEELGELFTLVDPVTLEGKSGSLSKPTLYFRLGESASGEPTQSINANRYREAQFADFYDPSLRVTKLEAAVDASDAVKGLTVIVTDLYQAEDNIKVVTEKLKQVLSQSSDMAVGLVGIRSNFSGKVYTEGLRDSGSFDYTGSHPFYVLLIGRVDEVHFYTNALLNRLNIDSADAKAVIYSASRFFKSPILLERKYQEDLQGNIRRRISIPASGMSDGKVNVSIEKETIQPFLFSDTDDTPIAIQENIKIAPLPYVLPVTGLDMNTQVFSIQNREEPREEIIPSLDLYSLAEVSLEDDELTLEGEFEPSNVVDDGIYFIEAGIVPSTSDGLAVQSWWSDWNANDTEQDGAKTHNLENFTSQLRELTIERIRRTPPTLGKLCYAIQSR